MNIKVKEMSKTIAGMSASGDALMVMHPFIESSLFGGKDIFRDEKAFKNAVAEVCERIDACKKPKDIMELVRPTYKEFWFAMCKDYMTPKEKSELMGILCIKKADWLKGANKKALMTKNEYAVFKKLPKLMTLYGCNGGYVRDVERAAVSAESEGRDYLLMAKVRKDEVLAYYNRRGEDLYIIEGSGTPISIA